MELSTSTDQQNTPAPANQQTPVDQNQTVVSNPGAPNLPAPASAPPNFTGERDNIGGAGIGADANRPAVNDDPVKVAAQKQGGRFHAFAEALAGGPQYRTTIDENGVTQRVRVPMSTKQIGIAIALEAVTGALSGLAARGPNHLGEAAERGFQAGAGLQAQRQQAEQADAQQQRDNYNERAKAIARNAAVMESNLRMMGTAIQVGRLQRDDHNQMVNSYADQLAEYHDAGLVKADHVSETEAKDIQKYPATDYLRIPDGTVPRIGPDGNPVYMDASGNIVPEGTKGAYQVWDNTYSLIDKNARATLTDDTGQPKEWLRDAVSWHLPGYPPSVLKVASGTDLPAAVAAKAQHQVAMLNALQSEIDSFSKSFGANKDGSPKVVPVNLKSAIANDPGLISAVQNFQRAAGASTQPDRQIDAMRQAPKAAQYAGKIIQLFGPDNLEEFKSNRESREAAAKSKAEARARGDEEIATAQRMVPVKAATAAAETKAKQAALASSARNEDGTWNMASLPVQLVEGNADPSQLSKRSADYDAKLEAASQYSIQKYGHPFDIAQAQSDYKFATNANTQNTLKYLNSLTGADNKSGNLGTLVSLSNRINRTDFPALNDARAWAKLQTGDPQMAAYYGAVTEVADQVAKIMQGGGTGNGTSDAKLKQAADLFKTGFNKDQITAVSQTLRDLLANRKSELIGGNRYLLKQYAPLTNLHTNPQTGQTIGWNGSAWVDTTTRQPVR